MHLTIIFEVCLPLCLNYDSWLCIKFIGVVWYRSYIKNDLPIYPILGGISLAHAMLRY
jgi:hypothetical protein